MTATSPTRGEIDRRTVGSLIAFETGESITYGLYNAQERGTLFIGPGVPVYEGMIVGCSPQIGGPSGQRLQKETCQQHAGSGSDEALRLVPYRRMSLEECLEFLGEDELLEVTPKNLRLRKRILNNSDRMKNIFKGK